MSNRRLPSPNAPGGALPDLVESLHSEGHLVGRPLQGAVRFLNDLRRHHGRSAGLVTNISEKVDISRREALRPPGGASIAGMDAKLNKLHPHERTLLAELVKNAESARPGLSDLGRRLTRYQTSKTTKAAATGMVIALCASLADLYEV